MRDRRVVGLNGECGGGRRTRQGKRRRGCGARAGGGFEAVATATASCRAVAATRRRVSAVGRGRTDVRAEEQRARITPVCPTSRRAAPRTARPALIIATLHLISCGSTRAAPEGCSGAAQAGGRDATGGASELVGWKPRAYELVNEVLRAPRRWIDGEGAVRSPERVGGRHSREEGAKARVEKRHEVSFTFRREVREAGPKLVKLPVDSICRRQLNQPTSPPHRHHPRLHQPAPPPTPPAVVEPVPSSSSSSLSLLFVVTLA
jgi:hypothetical protein